MFDSACVFLVRVDWNSITVLVYPQVEEMADPYIDVLVDVYLPTLYIHFRYNRSKLGKSYCCRSSQWQILGVANYRVEGDIEK